MCIAIGCDVMNFEINFICHIKLFCLHDIIDDLTITAKNVTIYIRKGLKNAEVASISTNIR